MFPTDGATVPLQFDSSCECTKTPQFGNGCRESGRASRCQSTARYDWLFTIYNAILTNITNVTSVYPRVLLQFIAVFIQSWVILWVDSAALRGVESKWECIGRRRVLCCANSVYLALFRIAMCSRQHSQACLNTSLSIRQEIQRFESVHPSIYALYDLVELVPDPLLAQQIRDHVVAIEGW